MNAIPDYSRYSLEDLYDVARRINLDLYPDRYALVVQEIQKRQAQQQAQQQPIVPHAVAPPVETPQESYLSVVTTDDAWIKKINWSHLILIVFVTYFGIPVLRTVRQIFFEREQGRETMYVNSAFAIAHRGDRIVFTDEGEGGSDLYFLSLKNKSIQRAAKTPEYEGDPAFSPDDKWIVYSAAVPGDDADHIFLRSTDGSIVRQLTREHQNDQYPTFSPDGKRIIFTRNHRVTGGFLAPTWSGHCSLYIMNVNGTNVQRLTDTFYDIQHPQFTPDGKSVVFAGLPNLPKNMLSQRSRVIEASNVFMIKTAEQPSLGKAKLLKTNGANEDRIYYASLSADGKKIVISHHESFLGLMDLKNSTPQRVESVRSLYSRVALKPAFSPDQKRILFLARDNEDRSILYQMDLDGANLTAVTNEVMFSNPLNWQRHRY